MSATKEWASRSLPVLAVTGFLLLWHFAASFYTSDQFPGPWQVWLGVVEVWQSGALFEHIRVSMMRFSAAYLLAMLGAIPLGLLLGRYTQLRVATDPLVQILRPISPIAWFPLAVLWFGIGNLPAIFIIFLSAFFPMLVSTISGVRHVETIYLKVAANFGACRRLTFISVILPAAFPHIVVGLHIALGTAWIHLVAGEMLGAQSGLGFMIVDARNFLRTDLIIAGMVLVGVLGLAINRLMHHAEGFVRRRWGNV